MLVDCSVHEPPNSTIQTEVCVIGSGPAGMALALSLARNRRRVVILETGGEHSLSAADLNDFNHSTISGPLAKTDIRPNLLRTRGLGGSSNCWMGNCQPLNQSDFMKRSWFPHSGWPIAPGDLNAHYQSAYDFLGIQPGQPGVKELFSDGLFLEESHRVPQQRTYLQYADEFRASEHLQIFSRCHVKEIQSTRDSQAVHAVRASTPSRKTISVKARFYVLAAGGIENPRLMMANNIGLGSGAVGRYYMTHPTLQNFEALGFVSPSALNKILFRRSSYAYLAMTPRLQQEQQCGATAYKFSRLEYKADRLTEIRGLEVQRFFEKTLRRQAVALSMSVRIEQIPNWNSQIRLDRKKDSYGVPICLIDWRFSQQDVCNMRTALDTLLRTAGADGQFRIRYDDSWAQIFSETGMPRFPAHHCGTTRMAATESVGVVDPDCRVFQMNNLFVAGSSVFPTAGVANPTLTIIALSFRLADHLKRCLEGAPA